MGISAFIAGLEGAADCQMNIILFHHSEVESRLSRRDARASHILKVLRLTVGQSFDAGIFDGPIGKGTLVAVETDSLILSFVWANVPPPPYPVHLLIGLPRPQTARDILRDATTLGVASLSFFRSDRGESGYANSTLWKSGEYKNCVINGAAQAFCTQLPRISYGCTLSETIRALPQEMIRLALDNYEAIGALSTVHLEVPRPVTVALGSERGWSADERMLLRSSGFDFFHLGTRVLRTETACIAALSLIKSKLGLS